MATTTRPQITRRASTPWRIGFALRTRLASLFRALAARAAAAQIGTIDDKEIGRHTGARV